MTGIQLILDPATAAVAAGQLGGVASVELADEQTVRFTLKAPNVDFVRTLAAPALWILPPDRTLDELTAAPSGTGLYKYQSYTLGERAVLVRNEGYWDTTIPYVDELQLVFIAESAAQVAALTGDTVNVLIQVGVPDLPLLESDPNLKVIENPLGSYHLMFGYHSTGAFNESGWQNPDLDALIESARAEADDAKRQAIFADLQKEPMGQGHRA